MVDLIDLINDRELDINEGWGADKPESYKKSRFEEINRLLNDLITHLENIINKETYNENDDEYTQIKQDLANILENNLIPYSRNL